MPYEYSVYISQCFRGMMLLFASLVSVLCNIPLFLFFLTGYCDGSRSIVNGSGINAYTTRESLGFSIYLKDAYVIPH